MNILITGSGTLAQALIKKLRLIANKIAVISRNEHKQYLMKKEFPEGGATGLRYFIGDIRDSERLKIATKNCDVVIHTAALKHVDVCEYNPNECLETNVNGTKNVIEACIANNVKKAIFVSTDKAPNPSTIYGTSKLMGERLWINANNRHSTKFSAVRYGNVIGSSGSFFHKWKEQKQQGKAITITDSEMNRFFFTIDDAVQLILDTLECMVGGEIFVKKMKAFNMYDIARNLSSNIEITGIRGYEKLNEILLTEEECRNTWETEDKLIIYPHTHDWCTDIELNHDSQHVTPFYRYSTQENLFDVKDFFKMIGE